MGVSWREYWKKRTKSAAPEGFATRARRDRAAREARSSALKREQSRKTRAYGKTATQRRLLDA